MGMSSAVVDSNLSRGQKALQQVGVVMVMGVIMFLVGRFSLGIFTGVVADGLDSLAYAGVCVALTTICLFLATQKALALFFLSEDNESLIYMPVHPGIIAIAKVLIIYISCAIPMVLIGVPVLLAAQISEGGSFVSMIAAVIVPLLIPVTPIFYVVLISLLLMQFIGIGKSKESRASTVTLIFMLLMLLVPMGFNFIQSGVQASGGIEAALKGLSGTIYSLECVFPTIFLAVLGMEKGGGFYLLLLVVVVLLLVLVYACVAEKLFLKAILRRSSHRSRQKSADEASIRRYSSAGRSVRSACARRERQLLFRTPVFFLQEVLISLILIVLFAGICVFVMIQIYPEIEVLKQENLGGMEAYVWYGALGLILIISALAVAFTHVTATCISREGSGFMYMKTMPVAMKTQLSVKSRIGLYLALAGALPFLIAMDYVCLNISISVLLIPASLVLSVAVIIFGNDLQLYLDCKDPMLNWETEYAAATNNHLLVSLVGPVLYVVVLIGIGALLHMAFGTMLILVVGVVLVAAVVLTAFAHQWFYKIAEKCINEL
ncbi:MAG: hypothetical protein GX663_09415 [Clostridiales bacterium]|nr:hypothetical protein [Clostridiales bacterium]